MIATIVKHQWFSGSPLPLNEWFGRNHWYQWFFNGFWSINHWPRCFFSLATIGLDGFAMVFGLATIGLDGFSMVANHWSNDGMVTIHRSGLEWCIDPHPLECSKFQMCRPSFHLGEEVVCHLGPASTLLWHGHLCL